MKSCRNVFSFSVLFLFTIAYAQNNVLRLQIDSLAMLKNADIGAAIYHFEKNDSVTWNGHKHYPMQSVFKFHLALAVFQKIDKGKLSIDQKIFITKKDLLPNTWSPLRNKYPDGNVALPLSDLLHYTVSQSDNNGCDILFRLIGGTETAESFIKDKGIRDISIKATEEEMHKAWDIQFTNWTTPYAAVQLLEKFYRGNILSQNSRDSLWKIMIETSTGPKKIKGQLPVGTIVGHKTGSSGTNQKGITAAENDIGIVTLPNGEHFAIAVFVSQSKESQETNEKIIADITKLAWDYFVSTTH